MRNYCNTAQNVTRGWNRVILSSLYRTVWQDLAPTLRFLCLQKREQNIPFKVLVLREVNMQCYYHNYE